MEVSIEPNEVGSLYWRSESACASKRTLKGRRLIILDCIKTILILTRFSLDGCMLYMFQDSNILQCL